MSAPGSRNVRQATAANGNFSALDAAEPDNDLVLATAGEGPQTSSRTIAVEPGTQEVQVRYKFVTTEVPGGYFGTQYNDYFNVSIRTQAEGGAGTESDARDNIRLQATRADGKKLDDEDFSVLWVTLQLRNAGSVSDDNGAKDAIKSAMGTLTLGTLRSTGTTAAKIWRNTVEIMGTVSPSNFKGKIKMPRNRILSQYYYNNVLQLTRPAGLDDLPGADVLRDFDPKPKGRVFDFDGPGIGFDRVVSATGDTRRQRVNFQQYATYEEKGQTKKASDDLLWYAHISIIKTAAGDALATDVAGDNQAAQGSTPLTWNLQP